MVKQKTIFILKQELLSILTLFVFVWVILLLKGEKDLPFLRSVIGTIFLSGVVLYYDLVLQNFLKKKLQSILFILISLLYFYLIFLIMLILYGYINLIFKQGYTINNAFGQNVFAMYPEGVSTIIIYLIVFVSIRSLIKELKAKTIRGIYKNYLFGKPNSLLSDKRIFMFMDLKSSTTYAEMLGHKKYSKLIALIINELDEYVLQSKGNIYQYVGDEVVIVWDIKSGIKNNTCLNLFFAFEKRLNELREYFVDNFGVIPQFKAGFHVGEVAITEIGDVLKREIAFHGDVVNTTARICALCGDINEHLLISEDLVNLLKSGNIYNFKKIGEFKLKGKDKELSIYKKE